MCKICILLFSILLIGCDSFSENNPINTQEYIENMKKEIKENITNIVFLNANREVINYKKPDFLTPVFKSIKKLCHEIDHVLFNTDEKGFHIQIVTTNNETFFYNKEFNDSIAANYKHSKSIHLSFKGDETERNCEELEKLMDFIQWDYENNDFTYPQYGVPLFIKEQLNTITIEEFTTLPQEKIKG